MKIVIEQTISIGLMITTLLAAFFGFVVTASAQTPCTQLSYTMTLGSSDSTTAGDVSRLQQFLKSKGYFNGTITGYYGPVTKQAVEMWQNGENFYEATGAGTVGPRSRAEILESCNAATITQTFVKSKSNKFKLSGTAEGAKSIFVAIVYPYTNEATDWHSVYVSGSYIATTGDTVTKVKNGKWSVQFLGIREGIYEARVYSNDDSSQKLLATQMLEVSAPDSFTFRAGSTKKITLGVGQTATDGGVTITLNDVFLTNGLSGMLRANFVIQSDGYKAASYLGEIGGYVPEGGGGIVDDEAPYGSMRIKIKDILQSMNAATFIVEGGKPKG
jgi:peptidoglycan hydrolase-like protein with peptidoglycan-binding domain